MRHSVTVAACATLLLSACNKHDTGAKPLPLSGPDPIPQVSLDSAAVATRAQLDAEPVDPALLDAGASSAANVVRSTAAHAASEPPLKRATAATACRVLVVGDSLSDPHSNGGGYLKPWAHQCPRCEFTNIARGGAMVNQMLRSLREHLSLNPPRYSTVVVFGGVNDLYSDQTAHRTNARIEHDLSLMYELARSHGARVFAITVAPWAGFRRWYSEERGRNTRALNQWILEGVARREVDAVIESGPLLSCGDPERLCPAYMPPYRDGLHFGPEGHRRLGAALLELEGPTCR